MERAVALEGEVALRRERGGALNSTQSRLRGDPGPRAAGATQPGHVRGVQAGQLASLGWFSTCEMAENWACLPGGAPGRKDSRSGKHLGGGRVCEGHACWLQGSHEVVLFSETL